MNFWYSSMYLFLFISFVCVSKRERAKRIKEARENENKPERLKHKSSPGFQTGPGTERTPWKITRTCILSAPNSARSMDKAATWADVKVGDHVCLPEWWSSLVLIDAENWYSPVRLAALPGSTNMTVCTQPQTQWVWVSSRCHNSRRASDLIAFFFSTRP